jgi:hypothetical protein
MAPQVGFEPTTLRLTAECSTIELLRSVVRRPFGGARLEHVAGHRTESETLNREPEIVLASLS